MLKKLLYKWFGLSDEPCETCEILREQLAKSDSERRDLLQRLLDKDKPEPPQVEREAPQEIKPAFVPWRVRQQMLEAEDRKQADLLRNRQREIALLEKEMGIQNDPKYMKGAEHAVGPSNAQVETRESSQRIEERPESQ